MNSRVMTTVARALVFVLVVGATLSDQNFFPIPSASAVSFLEVVEGQGLETLTAGESRVRVAHFAQGNRKVDVIWSRIPVELGRVEGLNWKGAAAYDLMGNAISLFDKTRVTQAPFYVVVTQK